MGARNPENNKSVKFYSLKAKVDATNEPYFSLTEKVGDEWKVTGTYNEMFGVITKAEMLERTFEGQTSKYFRFQLTDENEVSYIDMTHNTITYSILNSLASDFDTTKEITLRVYKKENVSEKDGKTYYNGRSYIMAGDESLSWAYEIKDLPVAEQVFKKDGTPLKANGFNVYDKEEVLSFWENAFLKDIQPKFTSQNFTASSPTEQGEYTEKAVPQTQTAGDANDDEDDLPF